jgi:hypothetical protein
MPYATAERAIHDGEIIYGNSNVKAVRREGGWIYWPVKGPYVADSAGHAVKEAATASGPIDFRRLSIKGLRQLARTASQDEFVKTFDAWITADNSTNVAVANDSAVDNSMLELASVILNDINKRSKRAMANDNTEEENKHHGFAGDSDIYERQYKATKDHYAKVHQNNIESAKRQSEAARSRFTR